MLAPGKLEVRSRGAAFCSVHNGEPCRGSGKGNDLTLFARYEMVRVAVWRMY